MSDAMKIFAFIISSLLAMSSQASYIGIDMDQPGLSNAVLPASNDYANTAGNALNVGQSGYAGATVMARESGPFELTFTYLFKEARYDNSFHYAGQALFNRHSVLGQTYSTIYQGGSGALDFFFQSIDLGGDSATVANGSQSPDEPRFHTFWEAGSNSLYLALDDLGAGPDEDFDDMMIKVTASAVTVPEPGTLALLALGLGAMGLGFHRRHQR